MRMAWDRAACSYLSLYVLHSEAAWSHNESHPKVCSNLPSFAAESKYLFARDGAMRLLLQKREVPRKIDCLLKYHRICTIWCCVLWIDPIRHLHDALFCRIRTAALQDGSSKCRVWQPQAARRARRLHHGRLPRHGLRRLRRGAGQSIPHGARPFAPPTVLTSGPPTPEGCCRRASSLTPEGAAGGAVLHQLRLRHRNVRVALCAESHRIRRQGCHGAVATSRQHHHQCCQLHRSIHAVLCGSN